MSAYGSESFFYMIREGIAIPEPHLSYQKDVSENDSAGSDALVNEEMMSDDKSDSYWLRAI
ncbi:hypothetical protein N7478_001743 [Penicillium angulare]|uniref:uncharacterized protein n=1 Tax=Penicillium angulare TaxID=116970 RepID=UPI00253F6BB5|nr:uncharacterized protein N7478_001743 [Penicillium angulare]KAJ5288713.1 hypothetical protein N7478_001743 [Penicillium angulare]